MRRTLNDAAADDVSCLLDFVHQVAHFVVYDILVAVAYVRVGARDAIVCVLPMRFLPGSGVYIFGLQVGKTASFQLHFVFMCCFCVLVLAVLCEMTL